MSVPGPGSRSDSLLAAPLTTKPAPDDTTVRGAVPLLNVHPAVPSAFSFVTPRELNPMTPPSGVAATATTSSPASARSQRYVPSDPSLTMKPPGEYPPPGRIVPTNLLATAGPGSR